jgi:hypothetical protein
VLIIVQREFFSTAHRAAASAAVSAARHRQKATAEANPGQDEF